ncbi:MAG: hypothetical protein II984_07495 [Clostridia bacterium]|nr:hypothetical protein [Clostridia bacterium]
MAQWQGAIGNETSLYKLYKEGLAYQAKIGISEAIPKGIDFYEGRQWPAATESTKNLPRPVINIVKQICRSKKSAILSTPVKTVFKSYTQGIDISKFNSFATSIFKELCQDQLDKLAIDDAVKKGSYFYHYYWDKTAIDLNGYMDGGVRCEIIDPLNIFFANPQIYDEQKQKWIMIASHIDASELFEICNGKIPMELIDCDKNQDGSITLLTRYFRINGEVYCERATKSSIITKPFPIAPIREQEKKQDKELKRSVKAGLYPVVCGFYEKRDGSIFGISEIEGLIPNQKSINFNIAMSLLNAQECAWGKYIALPNALKGQKISNVPGQVLIDHSGTGDGIKRMQEQPLSNVPMSITDSLIEMTKTAGGVTAIMGGELQWSNMSGVAIAQLQAQAQLPIEELRSQYWEVKRKQALVIAQFMKLYYYKKQFISVTTEDGKEKEIFDYFTSNDYENAIFDVSVEVSGGSTSSSASVISMLDNCLSNGKISIETYIKAYPDSALINKSEILKQIELEKSSELEVLRKELNDLKASRKIL